MTEEHSGTTGLKVVNVGRDGKRRYDRQTKQPTPTGTAFVPVVEVESHEAVVAPASTKAHRHTPAARTSSPPSARLMVQMPNGVTLRFECTDNDAPLLSAMIETLGRCDVPPGR